MGLCNAKPPGKAVRLTHVPPRERASKHFFKLQAQELRGWWWGRDQITVIRQDPRGVGGVVSAAWGQWVSRDLAHPSLGSAAVDDNEADEDDPHCIGTEGQGQGQGQGQGGRTGLEFNYSCRPDGQA